MIHLFNHLEWWIFIIFDVVLLFFSFYYCCIVFGILERWSFSPSKKYNKNKKITQFQLQVLFGKKTTKFQSQTTKRLIFFALDGYKSMNVKTKLLFFPFPHIAPWVRRDFSILKERKRKWKKNMLGMNDR